jgi:hypothetical protein
MANQDESFIREVNEELRSEQVKAVWTRFGSVIIGLAVGRRIPGGLDAVTRKQDR